MELTSSVQARHRGPRSSSRCSAHDRTHHAEDSLTRGRIVGGLAAAGVLLVGVAGNAQYMFVSTFRVKNDSAPAPVHVSLSLDQVRGSRHVRTVRLEPDTATTGWLRFTGRGHFAGRSNRSRGQTVLCLYHVHRVRSLPRRHQCRCGGTGPLLAEDREPIGYWTHERHPLSCVRSVGAEQ
jgi:hypothetical protein